MVERTLDVPSKAMLPEVHELLQAAMGWVDVHLHEFLVSGARYGIPDPNGLDDSALDETQVGLAISDRSGPISTTSGTAGSTTSRSSAGAAIVRGAWPAAEAARWRTVAARPATDSCAWLWRIPHHRDHDTLLTWSDGGLPGFNLEATDRRVRHTAGAVPESVRLLLAAIGEGVTLTPGGRLPRRTVRQIQERRSHWSISGKPAGFEEDLIPLAALHDLLREVGLLRLPERRTDAGQGSRRRRRSAAAAPLVVRPDRRVVAQLVTDAVAQLIADGSTRAP